MFEKGCLVTVVCAALVIPPLGAAMSHRAQSTPEETRVDVSIARKVAGQPYNFSGKAPCTCAPQASIYETNAQQWSVEHLGGPRSLSLTFWRPASGSADMFTLRCTAGGKSHLVSTVKTNLGGTLLGSGRVTFTPSGSGGTFAIDATTAYGAAITGTIRCSAFSPALDTGG